MKIIGNNPAANNAEITAVASGTLPSGKPVVVNADGTVSVVVETNLSGSETLGSQFALPTTNGQNASFLGGTYDSVNKKAIITYRDVDNSSKGTVVVGTVGESSVTWGTPVVFRDGTTQWTSCAFDSKNGKVVISYQDQGNSFYGTSIVGTVSGNSISFGTPVVFQSSETTYIDTTYDVSADAIVINYAENTGSGGRVIAGTVSGNSITFGSAVQFGGTGIYGRAVYHPEEECTIIAWRDNNPSTRGSAIALTVSGTTITLGTRAYYLGAGQANQNDIAYDSDSKKIVIICRDEVNTTYGSSIVGTVSGTTLTFASPVTFQSGSVDWMGIEGWFTGGVVMTYDDQSSGNKIILKYGTISGTTISWGTGLEVYSGTGNNGYTGWSMATDVGRLVLAYNANSDGKYRVYNPTFTSSSTNLTSENYIGMSGGVVIPSVTGSKVSFESSTMGSESIGATYDPDTGKIILAYQDQGNSFYGTAVVGTVSGTSISFGTPVVFQTSKTKDFCAVYDTANDKVVITYCNEASSDAGTGIVGTVSGTSISFGSPAVFDSSGANGPHSSVYDTNAGKVVVFYRDTSDSSKGKAAVGTVSGTSISWGSLVNINGNDYTTAISAVYDSTAQKIVVCFSDVGNSSYGSSVVGTVSGTSISFGTKVVFSSSATQDAFVTYDSSNNKSVVTYKDGGDSDKGKVAVATVSGTSISFGTPVTFVSQVGSNYNCAYDAQLGSVIISYGVPLGQGKFITGTVSGTSIGDFSSPYSYYSDTNRVIRPQLVIDGGTGNAVFSFKDQDDSNKGSSTVTSIGYAGQVADGDNAVVDIGSAISTNQAGLTAGQTYYVQTDGTIGLTAADPSVIAGTAISATEIIVKG